MKQKWIFFSSVVIISILLFISYNADHKLTTNISKTLEPDVLSAPIIKKNLAQSQTIASSQPRETGLTLDKANKNKIATCKKDMLIELLQQENSNDTFEDLQNKLKNNKALESQIAYALSLSSDNLNSSHQQLISLFTSSPNNKFLSYLLLSSCSLNKQGCQQTTIAKAIDIAPQNGTTWLTAALHELKHNNLERALTYLNEAKNAPTFNDFRGESLVLFDTALSQLGIEDSTERKVAAIGFSAALSMPTYSPLIRLCKSSKPGNSKLLSLCLGLGKQLYNGKSSLLNSHIGLELQKNTYQIQKNNDSVINVELERQKLVDLQQYSSDAHQLVLLNRKRANNWFQQLLDTGELETINYVINEAIELSKDPDFDPCYVDW